jgi:hypothetical protein
MRRPLRRKLGNGEPTLGPDKYLLPPDVVETIQRQDAERLPLDSVWRLGPIELPPEPPKNETASQRNRRKHMAREQFDLAIEMLFAVMARHLGVREAATRLEARARAIKKRHGRGKSKDKDTTTADLLLSLVEQCGGSPRKAAKLACERLGHATNVPALEQRIKLLLQRQRAKLGK